MRENAAQNLALTLDTQRTYVLHSTYAKTLWNTNQWAAFAIERRGVSGGYQKNASSTRIKSRAKISLSLTRCACARSFRWLRPTRVRRFLECEHLPNRASSERRRLWCSPNSTPARWWPFRCHQAAPCCLRQRPTQNYWSKEAGDLGRTSRRLGEDLTLLGDQRQVQRPVPLTSIS